MAGSVRTGEDLRWNPRQKVVVADVVGGLGQATVPAIYSGSRRRTYSDERGRTLRPPPPPSPIPLRVLHTAGHLLPTPSPSSSSTSERAIGLSHGAVPSARSRRGCAAVVCFFGVEGRLIAEDYGVLPIGMLCLLVGDVRVDVVYSLFLIFIKIAYEGKDMRAVADELKVIDLYVPKVPQQKGSTECGFMVLYFIFRFILVAPASFGTNDYPSFLTANWFSREEYEKFMEDLQGKRIHIDAQSASTSKVVKIGPTMLRSVHGLQSNECIPVKVNQLGQPLGEGGSY
ncbi:hypothetical protein Taro_009177 [Colocasia esculenta]|uniref:Ubiquitin-like protease family profile domain-containing protein n=1 Tax=Colocasia esculenta TaxID=4460 RepID=A0A843U509_COLES|nr:hypothetical protein [Colocasia esculenta]